MDMILHILSSIFWGICVLSFLVFIHEAGHFIAARMMGMRVVEFFLGLPSRARLSFRLKDWGTEIGVTPIVLGGYTKICGMEYGVEGPLKECLLFAYKQGSVSVEDVSQALDVSLDVAESMLDTLVDWASLVCVEVTEDTKDKITGVAPEAVKEDATGDKNAQTQEDAVEAAKVPLPSYCYKTVARDAKLRTLFDSHHDFSLPGSKPQGASWNFPDDVDFYAFERAHTYAGAHFFSRLFCLAMGPLVNVFFAFVLMMGVFSIGGITTSLNSNTIGKVEAGSIAAETGLVAGDKIFAIDGQSIENWDDLARALSKKFESNSGFNLSFSHDQTSVTKHIDAQALAEAKHFGIQAQTTTIYPTLSQSFSLVVAYTKTVIEFCLSLFNPALVGQTVAQSSSVVGISNMAAEAASKGIRPFLMLVAMISLSLGCMNLLPIVPLDGGKVFFELIALIIRRPVPKLFVIVCSYVGVFLFLLLFATTLYNDCVRALLA